MSKYTASDFANARFAEHPETGELAARFDNSNAGPWETRFDYWDDESMARRGWVPVPTKPTVEFTESQVEAIGRDAVNYFTPGGTWEAWARAVFMAADFLITPDPEPTNEERLISLYCEWAGHNEHPATLIKFLDKRGVTAPTVKGN